MNILKLCKAIAGTALLSFALMHAPAKAAVDFNADPTTVFALPGGTPIVSGDYTFLSTSWSAVVNGITMPYGVSNGTNMLVFANQGQLTVTRSDSGLFALNSLDAGGWLGLLAGNTARLSITGHLQGGGQVSFSTPAGLSVTTFDHFTMLPSFTNLSSLTFSMVGYSSSAYAAIDNLVLTPVPEPETYALFLAGLGLMAAIARRRRDS